MQSETLDFDTITKGMRTKSEKIRALGSKGAETADIARYLGIRYQHARNVLVQSGLHTTRRDRNVDDTPGDSAHSGESGAWVEIDSVGRLQLPAHILRAAGIAGNEQVHVRVSGDAIEVLSQSAALERARQIVSEMVPPGVSLVDELIMERRREAERENG
jgi:hypothetical protein